MIDPRTSPHRRWHSNRVEDASRSGGGQSSSVYMVFLLALATGNFPLAQLVEHECIVPEVPGSRPAWGKIFPGYMCETCSFS